MIAPTQPQPTTVAVPTLSPESWRELLNDLEGQHAADVARIRAGTAILTTQRLRETADVGRYTVPSCQYADVAYTTTGWSCTCPDATQRARTCKHSYAVILLTTATAKARRERLERQAGTRMLSGAGECA